MAEHWQYRNGYRPRGNVPAAVVGAVIAEMRDAGNLSASAYVDRSRPKDSPTHDTLTWDDKSAAKEYRLIEARQIIRATEQVVTLHDGEKPIKTTVYSVHVPDRSGKEGRYVASDRIAESEDDYAAALAELRAKHAAAWHAFRAVQRLGATKEGSAKVLSIAAQGFAAVDRALELLAS